MPTKISGESRQAGDEQRSHGAERSGLGRSDYSAGSTQQALEAVAAIVVSGMGLSL
jgi:hypothetical protein